MGERDCEVDVFSPRLSSGDRQVLSVLNIRVLLPDNYIVLPSCATLKSYTIYLMKLFVRN
jgi:hypothetical protein